MKFAMILLAGAALLAASALAETGVATSELFTLNTAELTPAVDTPDLPQAHGLVGCYPNPFNPVTTIVYDVAEPSTVEMAVFDLKGRRVTTLVARATIPAGRHEITWTGRDASGHLAATGVYLCRLEVAGQVFHQRLTLIK
jgi:hypothetical protein